MTRFGLSSTQHVLLMVRDGYGVSARPVNSSPGNETDQSAHRIPESRILGYFKIMLI